MDKYEYNTENFNRVDGCEVCSEDIAKTLLKVTGVDDEMYEDLENAVYDLYATCQNSYNRDSFRVFYKVLAIFAEQIEEQSYSLTDTAKKVEGFFNYYSSDEIEKDILIDPGYVIGRLLDKIGGEE